MVLKLALLVVLPMALAQCARTYKPVAKWAADNKSTLGVFAQCGVLAMILLGTVSAGLRVATTPSKGSLAFDFSLMIACVLTVHLVMLLIGHLAAMGLKMGRAERIAVGFSGSQKTLLVGLAVSVEDYANFPLACLPMVAYHVGQLLVDTIIADRLRARGEQFNDSKSPAN